MRTVRPSFGYVSPFPSSQTLGHSQTSRHPADFQQTARYLPGGLQPRIGISPALPVGGAPPLGVAATVGPAPSAADMVRQVMPDSGEALESDKLNMDGVGAGLLARPAEEVRRQIQVISLGSYCGIKMSSRRLGLGEASLPFDWIRTRVEGVMHWLAHGFNTFFHVQHMYEMQHQGAPLTVYRSNVHSFWHDNIKDEDVRDKLWRRVKRFEEMAVADSRTLLFVRVLAGTQELPHTEGLHDLLRQKFGASGRRVCLLCVIDDQPLVGPILLQQTPDILIWMQPLFAGALAMDKPAPFEEAIACGVRYFTGEPTQDHWSWPSVDNVGAIADPASPFRGAGFKETGAGLIAGNVLLKGQREEIMFAAFEGLDTATPTGSSQQQAPQPISSSLPQPQPISLTQAQPQPLLQPQPQLQAALPQQQLQGILLPRQFLTAPGGRRRSPSPQARSPARIVARPSTVQVPTSTARMPYAGPILSSPKMSSLSPYHPRSPADYRSPTPNSFSLPAAKSAFSFGPQALSRSGISYPVAAF